MSGARASAADGAPCIIAAVTTDEVPGGPVEVPPPEPPVEPGRARLVVLRPDAPASWTRLPAAIAEGITIRAETP